MNIIIEKSLPYIKNKQPRSKTAGYFAPFMKTHHFMVPINSLKRGKPRGNALRDYSSILKDLHSNSYRIEGLEFENFHIEEFMQLNDICYEKIDESYDKYDFSNRASSYRLNENYWFMCLKSKYSCGFSIIPMNEKAQKE